MKNFKKNFPFHLVTNSPWPLMISVSLMNLMINFIYYMYMYNIYNLIFSMINMMILFLLWMRDIIRESFYQGMHTNYIMNFMKFSMILFIISELFLFISFFWAYFHMFISPSIEIGIKWPPMGILLFNSIEIPLLNSIILIFSGFMMSISYSFMLNNKKLKSIIYMIFTIILGILFLIIQLFEYYYSYFTINDSIFSSLYFLLTGFHGFHVLIGILMLISSLMRLMFNQFSKSHHLLFEFSMWYWHFVDLIWLFLYIDLYWLIYL